MYLYVTCMLSYVSLNMRMLLVCGRMYSCGLGHNYIKVKMHFDDTNSLKVTTSLGTMLNLKLYMYESRG